MGVITTLGSKLILALFVVCLATGIFVLHGFGVGAGSPFFCHTDQLLLLQ